MVDQRGIDDQRSTIDARTAARRLGVDVRTLYAYAARGLVRSRPGPRGRRHEYEVDDIERLIARKRARSGHGPLAAGALRFGEPVLDSAITAIEPAAIRFRGHALAELVARGVGYERVAELLWSGRVPDDAPRWRARAVPWRRLRQAAPAGAAVLARLGFVSAWHALAPDARSDDPLVGARELVASLPATLAWDRPERAEAIAAQPTMAGRCCVALGRAPTPRNLAAIDTALVVSADHELNASTFAARVAASTGAELADCVVAGFAVMNGPRHGAMSAVLEHWLARAGGPDRAPAFVRECLRGGEAIPGFGHPLYPTGDPRVAPLLACARAMAPRSRAWQTFDAVVRTMQAGRRGLLNLDGGLVALTIAMGLPRGSAMALFAIGRSAGWIAHALEQRAAGFLLRPRARYTGA